MKHTISVLVENHSGVLSRISGLFSRRGFNIDSLAVGPTHDPSVSRITIVADGDEHTVEQIEKQLNKLIEVIKVKTFAKDEFLARELMIVKLTVAPEKKKRGYDHRRDNQRKGHGRNSYNYDTGDLRYLRTALQI